MICGSRSFGVGRYDLTLMSSGDGSRAKSAWFYRACCVWAGSGSVLYKPSAQHFITMADQSVSTYTDPAQCPSRDNGRLRPKI